MDHAGAECAFDRRARKIGPAGSGAKRRNKQMFGVRPFPILRRAGVLERNAAAGIVLREAAPRCEVELVGFF